MSKKKEEEEEEVEEKEEKGEEEEEKRKGLQDTDHSTVIAPGEGGVGEVEEGVGGINGGGRRPDSV